MCGSKDVGNNEPLVFDAVEGPGAFHQSSNALGGILDDLLVAIRGRVGAWRAHDGRRLVVKVAPGDRQWGLHWQPPVGGLENLPDEGSVRNDLGTPVFGSQTGSQDILGWRVVILELECFGDKAHIQRVLYVLDEVVQWSRVFGVVEHLVNLVQILAQVQLSEVTLQDVVVETVLPGEVRVRIRHDFFKRENMRLRKGKLGDDITAGN